MIAGMFRWLVTCCIVGLMIGGCAAPGGDGPATRRLVHVADRRAAIEQTLTLLRQVGLPPGRVDWDAGEIETRPTTSAQWFEFWRIDAPGAYQCLESSLHTVRRIVRIRLRPADAPAAADVAELEIVVRKQRLSAPARQVTTASGALNIYSQRTPTEQPGGRAHWVDLGRDPLLERMLLERMLRRGIVTQIGDATRPARTQPAAAHGSLPSTRVQAVLPPKDSANGTGANE